jgi:hypothetical protein
MTSKLRQQSYKQIWLRMNNSMNRWLFKTDFMNLIVILAIPQ